MIRLYSGTPGSGKSLRACYRIRNALIAGRLVICNYPIKQPVRGLFPWQTAKGRCVWLKNDELNPQRLMQIFDSVYPNFRQHPREGLCLLVIDEAGGKFNCRDWSSDPDRRDWLQFFPLHRKLGFDVLMIAQSDTMLDKQIRAQIETETRFRRLDSFTSFPLVPKLFCGVTYYHADNKTKSSVLYRETFGYRKIYGDMYDTYMLFG